LWFLRKLGLSGRLLLIDNDVITWHNMNLLPYASVGDADTRRAKADAAPDFMRKGGWVVCTVLKKSRAPADDEGAGGLRAGWGRHYVCRWRAGARRFLARRGFDRFFDRATNTDGSARALALQHGVSTCIECHVRARSQAPRNGRAQPLAPRTLSASFLTSPAVPA